MREMSKQITTIPARQNESDKRLKVAVSVKSDKRYILVSENPIDSHIMVYSILRMSSKNTYM